MKTFFGGLLLAIGILIAGGSGLCTLVFLGIGLSEGDGGMVLSFLPISLVIGGFPFAIGWLLILWGRWLLRRARAERPADDQGISSVDP